MATPRKGPSFAGPTSTGWTASSLTPATTTAVTTDPGLTSGLAAKGWTYKQGSGWTSGAPVVTSPVTGQPMTYAMAGPNDINPLTGTPTSDDAIRSRQRWAAMNLPTFEKVLSPEAYAAGLEASGELGGGGGGSEGSSGGGSSAAGGRGAGFGNRGAFTVPTPLESLLASIFPDEAAGPAAALPNPNTAAPQGSELFRTILGNLGSGGFSGGAAPAPIYAPSFGGAGAQIASTIPGAPAFLGGAINRVNNAGGYAPPPQMAGGGFNPAGIAALAAEQRIQAAEAEKARREAEAAWFQQQQQNQRAQAMTAQRQRQRFGGVNALTSGWGSSPVLY